VVRAVEGLLTSRLRALMPVWLSSGDHKHSPITPGTTSSRTPDTVDLAGSPTLNANRPDCSYMPAQCINDTVLSTDVPLNTYTHRHRIDKYLDTLLAKSNSHRPLTKRVSARWRTARVIISLIMPNNITNHSEAASLWLVMPKQE